MIFKYLNGNQRNFENRLRLILRSRKFIQKDVSKSVKNIINSVKKEGDKSLIKFEKKFSNVKIKNNRLKFTNKEIGLISKKIDQRLKNISYCS